jgi:hypothetical protein
MRASNRERRRKSRKPVTRDVLERLLASCGGARAIDIRDGAILLVAFAARGRRSEVATLRHSQIRVVDPSSSEQPIQRLQLCPAFALHWDERERPPQGRGAFVFAAGRAAVALHDWMHFAEVTSGPIFREIR